jgi:hypothetical protein
VRFVWLLAVAACGGEKKSDAGPASLPGSAPSGSGSAIRPTLSVKLDGAPLAMERAFIKRQSPDQWRLLVGDKEGSCDELITGVTNRQQGATSFVATISRQLGKDGKLETVVSTFWSAGHPTDAKLGAAKVAVPATPSGKKITVELAPIVDLDGKRRLEISGALVADGCGDHADVGVPKVVHASTATITVAGHKLPLRGAILDGPSLTLYTTPKDCSTSKPFAQVMLTHAGGAWELSGTWLAEPATVADKDAKLAHDKGATGTSPDGPTAQLALTGTAVFGDHKVELAGAIEAIDCTPPPPPKKP